MKTDLRHHDPESAIDVFHLYTCRAQLFLRFKDLREVFIEEPFHLSFFLVYKKETFCHHVLSLNMVFAVNVFMYFVIYYAYFYVSKYTK